MFPFHLVQSASTEFLLVNTHQVLNRSSKCANMRCRKTQVLDPKCFHNSFFVKNYYLNLNFFQVLQSDFLKNDKPMQAT